MNNNNNNNSALSIRSDGSDSGSFVSSVYSSSSISSTSTTIPTPSSSSSSSSSNTYLSTRPIIQQTPIPMNSDFDSSLINNNTCGTQYDQRRQIIHHLALLLHAHKCLQRERQISNNGDIHDTTTQYLCAVPNCGTMRTVLQHMTKCSDFKNCSFNNCVQSRHIILHWKNCATPNCFLCGSLKRSSSIRSQNPSSKEWQKSINQDQRSHLIKKITTTLLSTLQQDNHQSTPDRLALITNYAQKTEADTYNTATSQDDYFKRLAERIFKIQKEYEEKQTLKKQQTLTTILTPIDKSAGEQGPPNRIAPQIDYSATFSTTQIKTESDSSTTLTGPFDQHRISTDGISRLAIHSNNSNTHADGNDNHIKTEDVSSNHDTKIQSTTIVKKEETITTETSINGSSNSSITKVKVEMISNEKTETIETTKTNQLALIDASSKSLPKHPAVFSSEDIRKKMAPILHHLSEQEEGIWFRQPVTEAIAPGYFDIIKYPMDFSTMSKKLNDNQYLTPFQFCEDMWLVFNNAWTFNKKSHRVYKAGSKLADLFMELVDPIMKDYGYCCGRQYVFLPPAMFCYGVSGGICCTIPRDGDYFVYNNPDSSRNNLSGDKYTFCKKCFDSVKTDYISVGDDPAQTLADLPKAEFQQAKNDHQEPESMTDCIVCSRRFHNICVLYHEHIWPEGYVCKLCVQQYNIKRKENRYLAHKLTMTDLANALEKRVNDFLRKECDPSSGRVTIRVLAASDRVCEIKPRLKKHFGAQINNGYPYRTKAIFAFQEIDGIDVVLFGMHVQEYDSRCPPPNSRRVYVSYLDSVHYFRPKEKRTALYYELLIGYLEYVKQLGFIYAHIWACPPSEGDDYIFYCHPPEQRVPKPKRLQEWYKTMLDKAINQRVVVDYKDMMKDFTESGLNKVTDIPYFEGDFWTSTIEDLLKELDTEEEDRRKFEEEAVKVSDDGYYDDLMETEEPTETSDKRKSGSSTTHKKKNFKKTTSQRRLTRKNMTNGSDLISKIYTTMEKHKESFFVVRLRNPMSNLTTSVDTDPLIQCDLMESRDAFLNFAREKHCEFSSLRRAKYSTMVSLIELHSSTADKVSYTCNSCRQLCDIRYHCTVCEDYDLCSKCNSTIKHEHRMERTDDSNETKSNSETPTNTPQNRILTMQKMLDAIRHAVFCRNANCIFKNCATCKRLLQHTKECTKASRSQCQLCNKFLSPLWFHAKTCTDPNCSLPYCSTFKNKLQRQRAATMQADRRRMKAMHRANTGPGPSPISSQSSEPTTSGKYHQTVESASPSSTGKMMPSGGKGSKGGKPTSMSGLVRTNLSQPLPSQPQHPVYYTGGKGNPPMGNGNTSGYPIMMAHPQQPSQQWMQPSQQPIRYPPPGGKPMAYGQQRLPYTNDPYMIRQPTPQAPSSTPYPYNTPNMAPPSYSYAQPMDMNSMNMVRSGKPMLSQQQPPPQQQQPPPQPQQMPPRYPVNSYYNQPSPMTYQQQSQVQSLSHRSLSQGPTPNYSVSSNSAVMKANSMESLELKSDDSFDDPSKLQVPPTQQQQQQQPPMFHPLLQSCARPQSSTPYYSNMPPTNNTYYSPQRPLAPSSDYNMNVGRGGMRLPPGPPNTYGTLPVQQRMYAPPTVGDLTSGIMNNNPMGLQSTSPPSSVTPH